jgi:uncharacterized RDD family membrane protein YckC
VPRAAAFVIDLLVRAGLYLLLLPLAGLAGVGIGLLLLGVFLLEWFYPVFFELRSGATPGKRALKLLVVHADGTPIGPSASLLRNLLRAVDFLPVLYGLGLASMLVDRDFRRLGDLAAGALVVHREPAPGALTQIADVPPRAPPAPLDLETQQAILAFAERAPALSAQRRAELAALAAPSGSDADPLQALLGLASWLSRGKPADARTAPPGLGTDHRSGLHP